MVPPGGHVGRVLSVDYALEARGRLLDPDNTMKRYYKPRASSMIFGVYVASFLGGGACGWRLIDPCKCFGVPCCAAERSDDAAQRAQCRAVPEEGMCAPCRPATDGSRYIAAS